MPTPEFVHKVTPDNVAEQIEKLRCLFPALYAALMIRSRIAARFPLSRPRSASHAE